MMITLDELTTIQELDEIVPTQIVFNASSNTTKMCTMRKIMYGNTYLEEKESG